MLKIYNTYSKKKENFNFSVKESIKIYVCGITSSNLCHVGHARIFIIFDMVIRYLKSLGFRVIYIRNITDIDDKIIKNAKCNHVSFQKYTLNMISEMQKDFLDLNLLIPTYEPKVTDFIPDILDFIQNLIFKKHAYIAPNKDVVFSIDSFPAYGSLAKRFFQKKKINIKNINFTCLKNDNDFVLWKNIHNIIYKKPVWSSPWGLGRPGWHIECSAMSLKYFSNSINIHGGGIDLLFPHHENEHSQSMCLNSNFFVNFWMHVGLVNFNNNKMSKSLGNIITIRSLLKKYHPEVIRYFIYSTHYRSPLFYKESNIEIAHKLLSKIYTSLIDINFIHSTKEINSNIRIFFEKEFFLAMNNDFNTPQACSILYRLSQYIIKIKKYNMNLANALSGDLIRFGNILGLFYEKPSNFFLYDRISIAEKKNMITKLIKLRNMYRIHKKWEKSDKIRAKLLDLGVICKDHSNFTEYKY